MHRLFIALTLLLLFISCGDDNKDYIVTIHTPHGDMKAILYEETPLHKENFLKLAKEGQFDSTIFHRVIENFMIQGGDVNAKPNKKEAINYTIPAEFNDKFIHHKGALSAARQGDNVNPEKRSSGCQFYIVQGLKYTEASLTTDYVKLNQAIGRLLEDTAYNDLRDQYIALQRARDNQGMQDLSLQYRDTVIQKFNVDVSTDVDPLQLETYTTVGGTPHLDYTYTVFGRVVEGLEVIDKIAAQPTGRADKPRQDIHMTMELEKVPKKEITEKYGYVYPEKAS